jgi:hypothetical protein
MSWNQGNYIIKSEEVKVKGKVRRKVVILCLHHIRKHISCKILGEGMRACEVLVAKWYSLKGIG